MPLIGRTSRSGEQESTRPRRELRLSHTEILATNLGRNRTFGPRRTCADVRFEDTETIKQRAAYR